MCSVWSRNLWETRGFLSSWGIKTPLNQIPLLGPFCFEIYNE